MNKVSTAKKVTKKKKRNKKTMVSDDESDGVEDQDDREWCFCGDKSTENMIACDNPGCAIEWFHLDCINMNEDNIPDGDWFCQTCTDAKSKGSKELPSSSEAKQDLATPIFLCEWCESQFSSKKVCIEHKKNCSKNRKLRSPSSTPKKGDLFSSHQPLPPSQQHVHQSASSYVADKTSNTAAKNNSHWSKRERSRSPMRPTADVESCSGQEEEGGRTFAQFTDEQILAKLQERGAAFVCVCGMVFQDQTLYFLHRGCHNTSNPKKCSFCDFESDNWFNFTTHFFRHKKATNVNPPT